jgi:hypothetical protein
MSVVAGCALLDGVVLVSDSRATWEARGGLNHHQDNLEKLIAFVPGTAIGFVGSIDFASEMLQAAASQLRQGTRYDPFSLKLWFPRFFRFAYQKLISMSGQSPTVSFMIGSSIRGRPNIVYRSDIIDLLHKMGSRPSGTGKGAGMLWQLARLRAERIALGGTSESLLYTLCSPEFEVEEYRPLHPILLGTGAKPAELPVSELLDFILYYNPFGRQRTAAPSGYEVFWLRQALRSSLKLETVGGLFPAVIVRGNHVSPLGHSSQNASGQAQISLAYENGRWIQRNHTTGQELPLVAPWELKQQPKPLLFDSLQPLRFSQCPWLLDPRQ